VRSDDQPGPDDGVTIGQGARECLFGAGLERAVALVAWRERRRFVEDPVRREHAVGRDRRDQDHMRCAGVERSEAALDLRGSEGGAVDDGVERAAAQSAHVAVAIADEALHFGEQPAAVAAAVQHRDRMASRERGVDDVAPEEDSAAEDEQSHGELASRWDRAEYPPPAARLRNDERQ
jgi:hypothetical protein